MKKRTVIVIGGVAAALSAALVVGCGGKSAKPAPARPAAALPEGLFLKEAPKDPGLLTPTLAAAADGQAVTFRAKIGGAKKPFVAGRAMMMVYDTSIAGCDTKGPDHCATPWDYCCEPPDAKAVNAVSVQVDGPDGKPLAADLEGAGGLTPLREIVVTGVFHEEGGDRGVHATGIYVAPK